MWLITFMIAAILNAVMDTVENENFTQSDLKEFNKYWWSKRDSWDKAKKVFGWKFDAWHLSKSLMIILLVASMLLYYHVWWWHVDNLLVDILKDFVIAGVVWNSVFSITYKLLKT